MERLTLEEVNEVNQSRIAAGDLPLFKEGTLPLRGEPNECRFRNFIYCQHSDFRGYACVEDFCLSHFTMDIKEAYSPKSFRNKSQ